MSEITGLLLAAGNSRRFGSNKLLEKFQDKPLILHSAASLSPCDRVIAVVRESDELVQQLLQTHHIDYVINREAERGMSSSIACGVRATGVSDGWCILPADMPLVKSTTTRCIVEKLCQGAPLTAPFYRNRRGHPVGFSSRFRESLLALQGDIGAREILNAAPDKLSRIAVDDDGILIDIDNPQTLMDLQLG